MHEFPVKDVGPFLYRNTGTQRLANTIQVVIEQKKPLRKHNGYACLPYYYFVLPGKSVDIVYLNSVIKDDFLYINATDTTYNTQFMCRLTDA